MTWNMRFFSKKEDVYDSFEAALKENDSQFADDNAREQARAAFTVASALFDEQTALGENVEELEISLGGHPFDEEAPTLSGINSYVTLTVRATRYAIPNASENPAESTEDTNITAQPQ